MRLSDFILMNYEAKTSTVLHDGVLIAKRNSYDCLVFLFQMDRFYVEAFCNREHKAIEEYRVFETVDALVPYLETISIDELLA